MSQKTIQIRRIPLPIEKLAVLSDIERNFLFFSGHVLNEIISLRKVFMWCLNSSDNKGVSNLTSSAQGVQSMIYARILAGKLLEAWNELAAAWFVSKLVLDIRSQLHSEAQSSEIAIKKYFGKANLIFKVRNNFTFHYSAKTLSERWEETAKINHLETLLGGTIGNNLHYASELIVNAAVFRAINSTDLENGQQQFLDDIQIMSLHFTTFLEGISIVLLEKTLGKKLADIGHDEEVLVQQSYSEVCIPYFCFPDAVK